MRKIQTTLLSIPFVLFCCLPCYAKQDFEEEYSNKVRISMAMSLSLQDEPETVQKGVLCPCSITGVCNCSANNDCGCLTSHKGHQYKWVETNKSNQTALYLGDKQIGNYWHDEKVFKKLVENDSGVDFWIVEQCPTDTPKRNHQPVVSHVPPQQYAIPSNYGSYNLQGNYGNSYSGFSFSRGGSGGVSCGSSG